MSTYYFNGIYCVAENEETHKTLMLMKVFSGSPAPTYLVMTVSGHRALIVGEAA